MKRGSPQLPSCPTAGIPVFQQYVRGLGSSYMWGEFDERYDQNGFESKIYLCLIDESAAEGR